MNKRANWIFIIAIWALPWVMILMTYLLAPTYILPLLNSGIGRIALIGAFVWETIGCLLLERGNPPTSQLSRMYYASPKNIMIIVVFVVPAILLGMVGPAFVTIMEAMPQTP